MAGLFFNFLTYFFISLYLITCLINFFHPITWAVSLLAIFTCILLSTLTTKYFPLTIFNGTWRKPKISGFTLFVTLVIASWFFIVINRISRCVDTVIYHQPLALLMNYSVWFPGIGKISVHMALLNGVSVLASVFSSFKVPNLEFIPNFLIWLIFGAGIYGYLVRKKVPSDIALAVSFMFLLTPRFFWESYNMGNDMPSACFLALGLLSFFERNYSEAALFFAFTSVFKTLGQVAYLLYMLGLVVYLISSVQIKKLLDFKVLLSIFIFCLASLRMYISVGNPFYPALALQLAPWGISADEQKGFLDGSIIWAMRVAREMSQRSFLGFLLFLKELCVFPNRVNSSNWFSPFFVANLFSAAWLYIVKGEYRKIRFNSIAVSTLAIFLFSSWLFSAPDFRFIAGVFVFANIVFFVYILNSKIARILKILVYTSLIFTLIFFEYNVKKHYQRFIIPVFGRPEEKVEERYLPYKKRWLKTVTMPDGFTYSTSDSKECSRSKPPCLNGYMVGEGKDFIEQYKKYNKKFLFLK